MVDVEVNASVHGAPGKVVAVEGGQIVWVGLIEDIWQAKSFEALFCHDDDEERIVRLVQAAAPPPQDQR